MPPAPRHVDCACPCHPLSTPSQAYCISREQYDFVLDVTKFKSKAPWAEDPTKDIETKVKSAFTRTFNKQVGV